MCSLYNYVDDVGLRLLSWTCFFLQHDCTSIDIHYGIKNSELFLISNYYPGIEIRKNVHLSAGQGTVSD